MADVYIYSGATGSGDGSNWANAFTNLPDAYTRAGAAAGDHYWVHHEHNDVALITRAITLSIRGTSVAPDWIHCVDGSVSGPNFTPADLRNTAVCGNTGNFAYSINNATNAGCLRMHGINFELAVGGGGAIGYQLALFGGYVNECSWFIRNTNGSCTFQPQSGVQLTNCSVGFSHTSQSVSWSGTNFSWTNDPGWPFLLPGSLNPNYVMTSVATQGVMTFAEWTGMDFSTIDSLVSNGGSGVARFRQCKIHPNAVVALNWPNSPQSGRVELIQCNNTTEFRNERVSRSLYQTSNIATYRIGGASDGATPYSWRFTSTSNLKREIPGESNEVHIQNDVVGVERKLTVHIASTYPLNSREIWLEAEYYGSTEHRRYFRVSGGAHLLENGSALPSSSAVWSSSYSYNYELSVTFTPQLTGLVRWRLRFAKPLTSFYACPKAELSTV